MASEFLSRSGIGFRRRGSYKPLSEINVTPFVDVMLVLLTGATISAHRRTVGGAGDQPKAKAKSIAEGVGPVVITVTAGGAIFSQDTEVELENLVPRLAAITDNKPDTRIYLRGDKSINYGRVLEVMGTINVAGFTRVALVAELPKGLIRKARKRKTDE